MTDDNILKEIGEILSEPDALDDPGWERLRQGRADEVQKRELADLENRNPQISGAGEAFQPLTPEFQVRMEKLVTESISDEAEDNLVVLQPKTRKRRIATALTGTILAMAAAAALVLVLQPETPPDIVAYSYEFSGGEQGLRSSDPIEIGEGNVNFTKTSILEMRLRPPHSSTSPVRVQGFLVGDGISRAVSLPFQVSKSGVITVRGRVSDFIEVDSGSYKLVVLVSTENKTLPSPEEPLLPGARRVNPKRFEIVQPFNLLDSP